MSQESPVPPANQGNSQNLAPTAANIPQQVGRYAIVKKLGEGGMGTVYLATDTEQGTTVALKMPFFDRKNDETIIKRFLREARLATTIKHPNICPVFEAGEIDGRFYLAMAFVDGLSLADWIQKTPEISVDQGINIVRQLASGLQAAHDVGIIHRDLKPANIIVDATEKPIIIDFGMARRFDGADETMLTMSGAIVGTPGYMAPEQILANRELIGPATDIYTLGVILYELLTGWMPFSGNLATILGSIVSSDPPPMRTYVPTLSEPLERICRRALAKKPEDRYASAQQFAVTLEQFQKTGEVDFDDIPNEASSPSANDRTGGGVGGLFRKMLAGAFGSKRPK